MKLKPFHLIFWISIGLTIPNIASANVVLPLAMGLGVGTFFFAPVIAFIEVVFAYWFINKYTKKSIGLLEIFMVLLLANLITSTIGTGVSLQTNIQLASNYFTVFLAAYVLSVLMECIIVYLFFRKKIEKPLSTAFTCSLGMNLISYILIVAIATWNY